MSVVKTLEEAKSLFMQRVYNLITEKLEDSAFGVSELATELNLSRSSLHRKVKAITNASAGELINELRMKQAAQLLIHGYSSSKTAYKTGFDSPAYFSKCFKEYFGTTPTGFLLRTKSAVVSRKFFLQQNL